MKVLVIFDHPRRHSFCGAALDELLAGLAEAGHEVEIADLHAEGFDPRMPEADEPDWADPDKRYSAAVLAEQARIARNEMLVFVFPVWWWSLPAMLKGWVDRVLAMGRTYGGGRVYETGVFRSKRAMLSVTTGGSEAQYSAGGTHGDVNGVLRPIHRGIFQFIGCDVLRPQISWGPARATDEERAAMLAAWRTRAVGSFDEAPMDVGAY